MNKLIVAARVLLGLPLVVFGLNGIFQFMEPDPEQFTPEGWAFLGALKDSGYLVQLNGTVEAVCGLLLLTGRFVPLALVLFAPVMVNILGFHLIVDRPAMGVMAYVMLALHLFLAWSYWPSYRGVLAAKGELRS